MLQLVVLIMVNIRNQLMASDSVQHKHLLGV
jgi:hypothetical protein